MRIGKGRIAAAAALAAGIPLVAIGCGDSTPAAPATPATTTEVTTVAAPAAASTAAAPASTAAASSSALPAAPSGAKELAQRSQNGATYYHYSISGQTPQQIVDGYQSDLQSSGFNVKSTGGGGGGWGGYGGSGAGLSADNGSEWIDVEAGGQNSGPTYWEVCVGPTEQSVNDCQDIADHDSNSNQS